MTCKKTVARITYTVLVETLNPAQSTNQPVFILLLHGTIGHRNGPDRVNYRQ